MPHLRIGLRIKNNKSMCKIVYLSFSYNTKLYLNIQRFNLNIFTAKYSLVITNQEMSQIGIFCSQKNNLFLKQVLLLKQWKYFICQKRRIKCPFKVIQKLQQCIIKLCYCSILYEIKLLQNILHNLINHLLMLNFVSF